MHYKWNSDCGPPSICLLSLDRCHRPRAEAASSSRGLTLADRWCINHFYSSTGSAALTGGYGKKLFLERRQSTRRRNEKWEKNSPRCRSFIRGFKFYLPVSLTINSSTWLQIPRLVEEKVQRLDQTFVFLILALLMILTVLQITSLLCFHSSAGHLLCVSTWMVVFQITAHFTLTRGDEFRLFFNYHFFFFFFYYFF